MKMRFFLLAMVLFSKFCSLSVADDGVWQPLNSAYFMNQVMSIDIGYTDLNQKYIYAAEAGIDGNVWFSTNDGVSWIYAGLSVPDHGIRRIAVQKSDFRYAWALVPGNTYNDEQAGPFRYDRVEGLWTQKDNELEDGKLLYAMAVDYSSGGLSKLLVGGGGLEGQGAILYRTENSGDNWVDVTGDIVGIHSPHNAILEIAIDPTNSQIAYFILTTRNQFSMYRGLYKSENGGIDWTYKCPVFLEPDDPNLFSPTALAIDPDDTNRILVSVTEDLLVSTKVLVSTEEDENGHRIWRLQYELPGGGCLCKAINFSSFGTYMTFYSFIRRNEQFVVLSDFEGSGEFLPEWGEQPGDKRAWSIAVDPRNDANMYIGTERTIYSSEDFGLSVQPRVDGANILSAVKRIDADLPNIYFMADLPPWGTVYRSTDYGQNWSVRQSNWWILTSGFVHSDPGEEGLLFSGSTKRLDNNTIYSSIQRSTDYGSTWAFPTGWDYPGIQGTIKCLTPNTTSTGFYNSYIYFGISGSTARGLYWSSENGDNPQLFGNYNPPFDADPLDIAIHPDKSMTLIVVDGSNGLYRTIDHGANFVDINDGLPGTIANKIKYCPGQANIALTATPSGIYKSVNMNLSEPTWSAANYGGYVGAVEDLDFHPIDNSVVSFCVSDIGLGRFFISADTARSWIELNSGLDGHDLYDISVDAANPDTFYAATNSGVYKLKNPVKSGTLLADETWGPGLVIVNADVTIPIGRTLTIEPGTEVLVVYDFDKDGTGSSTTLSELIVYGTLIAGDISGDPVVFKSSRPTGAGAGDWYGIRAESGSNIQLKNCEIQHAVYGLKANTPAVLSVDNCTISNNSTAGIYINNAPASATVTSSIIGNSGTYGIYCDEGTLLSDANTISDCLYGIKYRGNGSLTVTDCAISCAGGGPTTSYYGIHASKSTAMDITVTVENCSISDFDQGGIYFYGVSSSGYIRDTFTDDTGVYGIYYFDSDAGIIGSLSLYNRTSENTYGLYLTKYSAPTVRRTKFWDNTSYGAYVNKYCPADFGQNVPSDYGDNSFKTDFPGMLYWDLYNADPTYVDAYWNFWGEGPFPNPTEIVGANYFPYFYQSDPLPARIAVDRGFVQTAEDFELAKAYPNPFNPSTAISFNLNSPNLITIKIFNIMGQEVSTVFEGHRAAGEHTMIWDGKNSHGESVSAGVYLCQ